MSYIKIDDVAKKYNDYVALKGFSLSIKEGEFVSLLGPSGCGKTSLLRAIAGLEDIHGGSISVNNQLMSRSGYTMAPERRNLGLIFQSYALWPHMTVFKNIAYGLKLRRWDRKDIKRRVEQVLDVVGLEGLEHRLPSELSGGQMQRVAVARSLAPEPAVLLFDEPLSNLDAKLRETMRFEIRRIQKEVGTTAIYVTHDQAEAMVISDRIILMDKGQIVQEGTARDLYERPTTSFAARFLGFSNLLPARVAEPADRDGIGMLNVDAVPDTPVPGLVGQRSQVGDRVTVSIRPEAVSVTPAHGTEHLIGDAQVKLPGKVTDLVYAGNLCDAFVDVGGTPIRAQLRPVDLAQLALGDEVHVSFDRRSVWAVSDEPHGNRGRDGSTADSASESSRLTTTV